MPYIVMLSQSGVNFYNYSNKRNWGSLPMPSIALILSTLFLSTYLSAQEIAVKVSLKPAGAWKKDEQNLIQDAAEKAFRRMARAEVANCAYRNASKENKDKLRKTWGRRLPVINKSRKVNITIRKKDLRKGVLGQARVDIAWAERRNYTLQNLVIDLSADEIFSFLNSKKKVSKADLWVNVIAHEVAHNLGYKHGSGGTWSEDYPGYFVTELGFCAMNEGRHGHKKRY